MWNSKSLKERFLKFFEEKDHKILPSSKVVPQNDPTLLFTNSGMVQFKDIFMGTKSLHSRVATVQNCIRAGGKHNDLDDVGKDNYHHTFFEMLGNWSFGSYFKEEAIQYAYEFLVEELKLDKERLYVTVFDEMDKESRAIWGKYFPESHIIASSMKDNFWEMGEFGPCGPCTEIHYDRIGNRDASDLVNKDDPNVLEIWNIVFMEYERTKKGLNPLKVKYIDTGIGFERLLSILMGVRSNYLIDSFQNIIGFLEQNCQFRYQDASSKEDVAFRVVSDHARTMAVCLQDGVEFSNEGVGYVLRRILRRAVRYSNDILGLKKGILSQAVKKAGKFMELNVDILVIDQEEELFFKTLAKGKAQFKKMISQKEKLDGADVFLLYDTYGFPKDLTILMAEEEGVKVDLNGFEEAQTKARDLSKSERSVITLTFDFPPTEDTLKYKTNNIESSLQAAILNNEIVTELPLDAHATLIFDKTCFYGECGGQVGDVGIIEFKDFSGIFVVTDTQIQRGYVLHHGFLKEGAISKLAKLSYNLELRELISCNHTSTHLFNYFLRKSMETNQEGSYVDAEKARFDFLSCKLSDAELFRIEDSMNHFIQDSIKVETKLYDNNALKADSSVIRIKGEEYPDKMRVICMSNSEEDIKEICGGTHVSNTSFIKLIRIISESGVKANTRRVILCSSKAALDLESKGLEMISQAESGSVLNLETTLSLHHRRRLEKLNSENHKKAQTAVKDFIKSEEKRLNDAIVLFKMDNLNKDGIFVYKLNETSLLSAKELKSHLSTFACKAMKSFETFLMFIEIGSEVHVNVFTKDFEILHKKLQDSQKGSFNSIPKKLTITGVMAVNDFDSKKIISLMRDH